jgi:uncharacterized membrane protein
MMKGRLWEIDTARGVAIVIMVAYHFLFDLNVFFGYQFILHRGFWFWFGRFAFLTFVACAGISSTFSRSNLLRGRSVFLWGMLITTITYLVDPGLTVRFGILHFMGISMMIYHSIAAWHPRYLFMVGTAIFASGPYLSQISVTTPYLFPLGLTMAGFSSSDYYPLLPWFGVFLLGAAIGKTIYSDRVSIYPMPWADNWLAWMGRRSLIIYLVHQPLIMAWLLFYFRFVT